MVGLYIFGAGGHARELMRAAFASGCNPLGFVVDPECSADAEVDGLPVFIIGDARLDGHRFVIGVGSSTLRREIDQRLSKHYGADCFATLIHPSATIGNKVNLEPGAVVCAGAVLTTNIRIGRHAHINTRGVVSHDCVLGDYAIVQPGAVLCGNVTLGDGVEIGAGATIIQRLSVGRWSRIGAGATVIENVPSFCTAVGVPAKVIK